MNAQDQVPRDPNFLSFVSSILLINWRFLFNL